MVWFRDSFGRSGKMVWFREPFEHGCMVLWQRFCIYAPSEGVRKMRERVSPSEGGMKRCRCGKE